jgi:FAD:protein FMN transferase
MKHRPCIAALLACLLISACSQSSREQVLTGPTMGTTYTVKVVAVPPEVEQARLQATIDEVLAEVDRTMSIYRDDSQIARFNATLATDWYEVSAAVARVVATALEVSELSGGAFDITVGPLVKAWGFGPDGEPKSLPTQAEIDELRARVGFRKLHVRLDPPALRKDIPTLGVDLNGIAPGFTVDRLAERLLSQGVANFMIDLGGEVRVHGRNAQGEPWRIAVERPVDAEPTPYAILRLDDMAVTTSGEYRQYYVRDGQRYSHTIDPRTGWPVRHDLASVVVIDPRSMYTDAWATAFNVLGSEAGHALAVERNMPVLFIEFHDGELRSRATPAFERHFR